MTSVLLALALACSAQPRHDHDHSPAGDEAVAGPETIEAPLGGHTARLVPGDGTLELIVLDADGELVAAEGEAHLVLAGVGEKSQRLVLEPTGSSWKGQAKATGAGGYRAVLSVTVAGAQRSTQFSWGDAQGAAPVDGDHQHDHHEHGHVH